MEHRKMADFSAKHSSRKGKAAQRGRPLYRAERKESLNLSITPMARCYLEHIAVQAQTSISEVVETWVTGMMKLNHPLKPLGRGSKRKGHKAMRGTAINYDERKARVNLSVTPTTKQGLQRLAREACDPMLQPSVSDVVERWVISVSELYQIRLQSPELK
jgi:hypothetical protein